MAPQSGCEAEFFGAEAVEQLFFGPAGLSGDLGEKDAGVAGDGEADAVVVQIEVERSGGGPQGGEDADFDFKVGQFIERDGIVKETWVFEDAVCGFAHAEDEGLGGLHAPDAAAQGARDGGVERDEASGGLEQGGIGGLDGRERLES